MIRPQTASKRLQLPIEGIQAFRLPPLTRAALFDQLFDHVYAKAAAVAPSRGEAEALTEDFFAELSLQVSAGSPGGPPGIASEPGRFSLN